jgi:hypothetical protein
MTTPGSATRDDKPVTASQDLVQDLVSDAFFSWRGRRRITNDGYAVGVAHDCSPHQPRSVAYRRSSTELGSRGESIALVRAAVRAHGSRAPKPSPPAGVTSLREANILAGIGRYSHDSVRVAERDVPRALGSAGRATERLNAEAIHTDAPPLEPHGSATFARGAIAACTGPQLAGSGGARLVGSRDAGMSRRFIPTSTRSREYRRATGGAGQRWKGRRRERQRCDDRSDWTSCEDAVGG